MDELTVRDIAQQACREENLGWSVSSISRNLDDSRVWDILYDAWGRKYHKILVRVTPEADSTRESLTAEVRAFLRSLKKSGRL